MTIQYIAIETENGFRIKTYCPSADIFSKGVKKRIMKYIIQRVSDGTNTYNRPCKEAILEGRTHYFTNDDDDNEEYLQMEDYSWTVEFHSLEELNEFIKKHGNIIIEPSWEMDWVVKDEPRPEMLIKIYDSDEGLH